MEEKKLSFELVCELKQQTPMIHFRCDEHGATLRATELKPKLDKYIIKCIKNSNKDVDKAWFIKDTEALNYKVHLQAPDNPELSTNRRDACKSVDESNDRIQIKNGYSINGMYFANIVSTGSRSKDEVKKLINSTFKETVMFRESIKMTIICFIPELLKAITDNIEAFFILHNFGSRQSKGFGGFTVAKIDGVESKAKVCNILKNQKYFYTDCPACSVDDLLNHAGTVYSVLKGGLNMTKWNNGLNRYEYPERYFKSYVQRTFLDEFYKDAVKIGSEKAFIKSKTPIDDRTPEIRLKNDLADKSYQRYVFIRAMLGLADNYKFSKLRYGTVNVYSLGENSFDIERFKSPITIKIIGNSIYFIFDVEKFEMMQNKTFYLLNDGLPARMKDSSYTVKKDYIERRGWKICTPEVFGSKEVDALIKGFVEYFNKNKEKLNKFGNPQRKSSALTLKIGEGERK